TIMEENNRRVSAPSTDAVLPPPIVRATPATDRAQPTLADFWKGAARFQTDVPDTGLPMGESDTIVVANLTGNGHTLWSYVHASHPALGVVDQCGAPVEFPGCLVIFTSADGGRTFTPTGGTPTGDAPTCQIPCRACPCTSTRDHIDQQQYPRVQRYIHPDASATGELAPATWLMVYEYRANLLLRRSADGWNWSAAEEIPLTGIWQNWLMRCPAHAAVGPHPFAQPTYDCLVGSPPGLVIDAHPSSVTSPNATPNPTSQQTPEVYVFMGLGQNPSAMGCYRGPLHAPATLYRQCDQHPLFVGSPTYGPTDGTGPVANPYFDFRTISSADVIQIGDEYYMLYEGVRGPSAGAAGDTQFTLGLARTTKGRIDGPWETYSANPILVDMPGNVGVGHADLLVLDGTTYVYTSLDGVIRSRLRLAWHTD
ncbi:MAG: hypothetical protein WDZ49_05440, partial [Litorilinea sp.]